MVWRWAPGAKPRADTETYLRLGDAAARIHTAADSLPALPDRDDYDLGRLIDEQLHRMRPLLERAGVWSTTVALAQRSAARIRGIDLDRGLCHLDLTLDNVHLDGDELTVFDFDGAGRSWRAMEPAGVLRFSASYFGDWLTGYRAVRPFGAADAAAVATFAVIDDFRIVTWQLGVAESSRGQPLLGVDDLPGVVNRWQELERAAAVRPPHPLGRRRAARRPGG